jgi:hypothetical protein
MYILLNQLENEDKHKILPRATMPHMLLLMALGFLYLVYLRERKRRLVRMALYISGMNNNYLQYWLALSTGLGFSCYHY